MIDGHASQTNREVIEYLPIPRLAEQLIGFANETYLFADLACATTDAQNRALHPPV